MVGRTDIAVDTSAAPGWEPSGARRYEDWIITVKRAAQLPSEVPPEIADVFEACVGAIMCGWVYRPLLTLGTDQVMALREKLARTACEHHGATKNDTTTFANCLAYLYARGLMPAERRDQWARERELHHDQSQPDQKTCILPDHALLLIEDLVADARMLFPATPMIATPTIAMMYSHLHTWFRRWPAGRSAAIPA